MQPEQSSLQSPFAIAAPTLPRGGGAIQGIGNDWSAVGATGAASLSIPLPITPGRGFSPGLGLVYSNHAGRSEFGQGWQCSPPFIGRYVVKGPPAYDDTDEFVLPDGNVLMAERDDEGDGGIVRRAASSFRGISLGETFDVVRYLPRVEGAGERIESWRGSSRWFWMVHAADGTLHLYGVTQRTEETSDGRQRIAQWWLEESVAGNGEKIRYQYDGENDAHLEDGDAGRDHANRRYLRRVLYGNEVGSHKPDLLDGTANPAWFFELLFDYGERDDDIVAMPTYEASGTWPRRQDPVASFGYGFEVRTLRLCRQVLMFHRHEALGPDPVLTRRLLLRYDETPFVSLLSEVRLMGYGAGGEMTSMPPLSLRYGQPRPPGASDFKAFDRMPGLNDGALYQLVDLYGEGVPGILHTIDGAWYYREPLRAEGADADDVAYAPPVPLCRPAPQNTQGSGMLTDLTGDGRLDWLVMLPSVSGFFTIDERGAWSRFVPFDAFPSEFRHDSAQMADLTGNGMADLVLVGSRSVRIYPNEGRKGFGAALDVDHDDDLLPAGDSSRDTLITFADPLGTGQQHLVRIRYDGVTVWPSLGRGRFGRAIPFAVLPFAAGEFDSSRVRVVDVDGSGAVGLVYAESGHLRVFRNRGGNGLEEAGKVAWPEGVRFDDLCELSVADVRGYGVAGVVLGVPHMVPRHWHAAFASAKPYLLEATDNHMGSLAELHYRSSAQEWLDAKAERAGTDRRPRSELPFPVHVLVEQCGIDEITGQRIVQRMTYRDGFYDRREREFRGFGFVERTDSISTAEAAAGDEEFTAPSVVKTWFHVGRDIADDSDFSMADADAPRLGGTLVSRFAADEIDDIAAEWDDDTRADALRALSGSVLRVETFGLDGVSDAPYAVAQSRYLARVWQPRTKARRFAVVQPFTVETLGITYERLPRDPRIQHDVGLRWDRFGMPVHGVVVHYARREGTPPFGEEHLDRWWSDSHDEAQRYFYFTESRAEWLHHDEPEWWRVGLPWRTRGDAFALAVGTIGPGDISYESLVAPEGPMSAAQPRTLTGQAVEHYEDVEGTGFDFPGLHRCTETAEFDERAMSAYDEVMTRDELRDRLQELGYARMKAFLPGDDRELWSARRDYVGWANVDAFFLPTSYQPTEYLGTTSADRDRRALHVTDVRQPDGCVTHIDYDYRLMQPWRTIDPNKVVHEVLYDGLGRVLATSFHGMENGLPVGFAALDLADWRVRSPDDAIADPAIALGDAATACFYDSFAWTDQGRPPHAAVLVADRYPGDPEKQIRISVLDSDGFGRALQQKQLVPPGDAYQADADGRLLVEEGKPVIAHADLRWRVSERVEYNNKALPVRIYRPYFAATHRYIHDEGFRQFGYCDRQYYDPLGRPTVTLTAAEWMRRQTYWPWYTVSEDENDTAAEMEARRRGAS